jgi:poly(3-hydroxybutyrate) depolymerase
VTDRRSTPPAHEDRDARPPSGRRLVLAAAIGTVGLAFAVVFLRSHRSPAALLDETTIDSGLVAWCADGLEPIPGGGCLAMPDAPVPVPLVVYLHGLYDRTAPAEELERQHRVAARATARGFAVLALRSLEGACHPSLPAYSTRYCWPSNEEVADHAGAFVEAWQPAMGSAEARAGRGPRYVLGFSSGGFFAGLLAVRGLYPADAFVVAHAGPVEPVKALGSKPPILLLSADDDVSQEGMVKLDDELSREQWPHQHAARSGGHALTDWDIDAALGFFAQVHQDPSVVRFPTSGHRPRARDQDGAVELTSLVAEAGAVELGKPAQQTEAGSAPPADDAPSSPMGASGDP